MAKNQRIKVGYDIDDTLMSFNVPFMRWAEEKYGIDFSRPTANGFKYNDRHKDIEVDWLKIINEFTINVSVDLMEPFPGLIEHFEEFRSVTEPFIVTSRPKEHRKVTEMLIKKHLSKYIHDLQRDIVMPDELGEEDSKPSKADICEERGAILFFEDAVHNYESFLRPGVKTRVILFRTETSVWNHHTLPVGMRRIIHLPSKVSAVESWEQASGVLRDEIAKYTT